MGIVGLGLDLCKVARMQAVLSKPTAPRFLAKVLHAEEQREPVTPQFLASRWAAKEALVKASGLTDLQFHLMKIGKMQSGKPSFELETSELEKMRKMGVGKIHLSLTHEDEYAAAVVVLEAAS
jgi:holo-[acyl-carrier protein] synthase